MDHINDRGQDRHVNSHGNTASAENKERARFSRTRCDTAHEMMRSRAQRKETFGLRAWRDKNAGGVLENNQNPGCLTYPETGTILIMPCCRIGALGNEDKLKKRHLFGERRKLL